MIMTIYEFLYNSCTCESSAETMSLHKTLKGAYKAMRKHRWDACVEHREEQLTWGEGLIGRFWFYDSFKWWGIRKADLVE